MKQMTITQIHQAIREQTKRIETNKACIGEATLAFYNGNLGWSWVERDIETYHKSTNKLAELRHSLANLRREHLKKAGYDV